MLSLHTSDQRMSGFSAGSPISLDRQERSRQRPDIRPNQLRLDGVRIPQSATNCASGMERAGPSTSLIMAVRRPILSEDSAPRENGSHPQISRMVVLAVRPSEEEIESDRCSTADPSPATGGNLRASPFDAISARSCGQIVAAVVETGRSHRRRLPTCLSPPLTPTALRSTPAIPTTCRTQRSRRRRRV